jgi:hypothetical protein
MSAGADVTLGPTVRRQSTQAKKFWSKFKELARCKKLKPFNKTAIIKEITPTSSKKYA